MQEQVESDAEKVSNEIDNSQKTLEENMQEVQEAESETRTQKEGVAERVAFLEGLGVHAGLDGVDRKLETDLQEIEATKASIVETRKLGEDAQRMASTVGN